MALNNYGKALGQLAQESVKGSVKGFAMGIKGAAMREMPGLTAMYGLHREVKDRANKLSDASAIDASVKEQRTNNIISIEMVRQLRSINNNVLQQTRISALQANNAKQAAMFAEENDREKTQRDKELLDAIKSLKGDGKGAGGILGAGGVGAGGKGLLGTLFDVLQNASLLEAIGTLAGGKYVIDKGKAIFGKGAGGVPTTGGGVPTTGGAGGGGKPPTGGGGKVIPFPPGGRGGVPPTGGAGGGLLRGGLGLAARGALRFVPYIGWALLAAEVGYEAYKIFGASGGQGLKRKKEQDNLGGDYDAMGNYTGGGAGLGGGVSQTAQKVVRGTYAVGDPRRRSTVGAVGEDAAKFITGKEGFVGKATKDTNKMAIGYGHNITDAEIKSGQIDLGNGEFIKISGEGGKDTTVTKEQAGKLFSKDLGVYESIVVRAIGQEAYNKLSQNQKTAILSYVYNTGKVPAGFAEAIKAGNYANAAKSIRDGVATASGEKDPERRKQLEAGLKKRRKEEGDLFDTAGPATSENREANKNSAGVLTKTGAPITPTSRAIPVSDVATADSMYVDDGNGLMVLKSELSKATQSRSGSVTRGFSGPIQVEDKKANLIATQQLKSTKVVARQTGVVAKSTTARETRKQTTLLQRANQTFLNQFQSTTQRLLSKAIYDTLVVGAYGKEGSRNLVTKQQTLGETFRGQQVAKILGLNKGTEKVLTGVFGKQIGKAYAPMVAQLGTAYLEVGATKVGRDLFSSILGNDKNADALTGQILGNFARGNKQAATEQLLYGLTGVASGPETIFAKYGFNSSQQGANFLGGYGAAQLTAPLAGMMGGNQPTYRGPNGQGTYGAGQTPMMQPATQQGAYYSGFNAKGNQQNFVNPEMMKLAIEGDKAAQKELPHIADGTWENLAQAKADLKLKTEQYLEAKVDTAEFETARAAQAQAQARLTERTNEILASKPSAVGGGSSAGGTFMSSMGNFAFDLGTSLVASKLTQGIKNPYAKAFANFAVASAANSFIKPMIFGAPTIAGAAASATPSLFTASNASSLGSSFLPSSGTGVAGTAGNILAASGYTQAGSFMSGVQSGMNIFSSRGGELGYRAAGETGASAMGELVGEYLPYAASIVKLLQGDVKGAVLTAAGTYIGAEIGFAVAGPAGAIVGSILGSIFGGSVGQRTPKPAVLRVTSSSGNEISAVTAWAKDSPPEAWSKFADTILVGLLNSAKLMQQQSGVTLPFVNIGIYVDSQSGISLCLYQEGEATNTSALPKWSKNFGSIKDFKMGTAIVGMIEFMRDCLKEGKDAITADKLDKATAELKTKNIQTITTGVLSELKAGGQYDLTKGVGYNSGTPTSDGRSVGKAKARITGVTTTAATMTPAARNTSAANLTSSAQTTTLNNSAPINSVVAVGGKTENDNSMSITNINQMSPMADQWRQPAFNTGYQLVA
jgi:GH24 family phage-related lysozyme (muramidase)